MAGLSSNALKGVHDGHGLGVDDGIGVHLLQYLVNVTVAIHTGPSQIKYNNPYGSVSKFPFLFIGL